jgi:hypothetical protein
MPFFLFIFYYVSKWPILFFGTVNQYLYFDFVEQVSMTMFIFLLLVCFCNVYYIFFFFLDEYMFSKPVILCSCGWQEPLGIVVSV